MTDNVTKLNSSKDAPTKGRQTSLRDPIFIRNERLLTSEPGLQLGVCFMEDAAFPARALNSSNWDECG
ncbi:hypothetical protein VTK56DRAFT_899 [Thermocarpiscus australiensis]